MELASGDYIQWLDADDLLSPDKIALQLELAGRRPGNRLLSSGWGYFAHRPSRARFVSSPLWRDHSPVDWLACKLATGHHMQTATWLTRRDLCEAAGPWDTRMLSDDDGEYFARVLLASDGVLFEPVGRVYYRSVASGRLSFIGFSDAKMDAMLMSMRLHIDYLLRLEDSHRTRAACGRYLEIWWNCFNPVREDIARELRALAGWLGVDVVEPSLRTKYRWLVPIIGKQRAWRVQTAAPGYKARVLARWDELMNRLESGRDGATPTYEA
jgi:hypothetical protein